VEGSAEYYSSVVYPGVNAEYEYLDDLDARSPDSSLIFYSYPAYAFFEYLDAQGGMDPAGIVDGVLRQLPTTGGYDDQQAAVVGLSGITEAFHAFGQAYLDKRLEDLGGGTLPLHPQEGETSSFPVGSGQADYTFDPLVLHRYRLSFADHARFDVAQTPEGEARISARPASAPGAWSDISPEVNTACGDSEFVLLVTNVVPPGADQARLELQTGGERLAEDLPCDECVVGSWALDNESYFAHLAGLWPPAQAGLAAFGLSTEGADAYPTNVFGSMLLTFEGDGVAKGEQVGWGISGEAVKDGDVVSMDVVYNGTGEAAWRIQTDEATDERYLFFDAGSFNIAFQAIFQGFPLDPRPTGGSNDPVFLSVPQPFLCSPTTLTYNANDPLGPIVFFRVADEVAPEP
jgi:hypothetical protein